MKSIIFFEAKLPISKLEVSIDAIKHGEYNKRGSSELLWSSLCIVKKRNNQRAKWQIETYLQITLVEGDGVCEPGIVL